MSMNTIIQEQRKLLGLTQEQVADYLGVSTPAVSKWEKGITSPDIGLIPQLARLLKVDLNTLFCFNENLSVQEIEQFCEELSKQAFEDIVSAFETAEAKIHEYPYNEQLLLQVTIILDSLLQMQGAVADGDDLDSKISDWYFRLSQSNDDQIKNSANYMRVNRYIRQGKAEAAQEALDAIKDKNELIRALPDKLMLQVSIYLQQNKADLAALELEKLLFQEASRVHLLLTKLADAELLAGNRDYAQKIAEKASAVVEAFDMWEYDRYVVPYQIAEREKDADTMLPLLEQMLEAMETPWSLTESVLYHRMTSETKEIQPQELKLVLLNEIESAPQWAYLREHPGYHAFITKYKM